MMSQRTPRFARAARTLRLTILAFAVMCAGTTATLAAGLFRQATPSEAEALASQIPTTDPTATRRGVLIIDTNYLRARIAPPNLGRLPEEERAAAALRLPTDVRVELFFDTAFEFQRITVGAFGSKHDGFWWYGEAVQPYNCQIQATIMTDVLERVVIQCGGENAFDYVITHIDGLYYGVEEVPARNPTSEEEGDDFEHEELTQEERQRILQQRDSRNYNTRQTTSDVTLLMIRPLLAGPCGAEDEIWEEQSEDTQIIGISNTIMGLSEVNVRFVFAGHLRVYLCHEGSYTMQQIYTDLKDRNVPFDDLDQFRDEVDADLVLVYWPGMQGEICGKAFGALVPGPTTTDRFFAVADFNRTACNYAWTHELGHLFGLQHDRYAERMVGVQPNLYRFGYVNVPDARRTVMAYAEECVVVNGVPCPRIGYMSTPDILTPNGFVIGIAPPDGRAAFAARRMNETAPAVAAYR